MIGLASLVSRSPQVISREIEGGTVATDLEKGNYYGMDLISQRIWQLIEREVTVAGICTVLTREYEVEEFACQREVIDFLCELHNEGLIEVHDSTSMPASE